MELTSPDELERVLDAALIAFVPVGTFEHRGWHLPVCFDGIKAHSLCERVAERTGGTVLPTFFYGTGDGHMPREMASGAFASALRPGAASVTVSGKPRGQTPVVR
jgi:creatinine amidohydrolase/Fe(II)-dependent formamide hydrolase-like protein